MMLYVFAFFHSHSREREWLNSQPPASIDTWDDLVQKIKGKVLPISQDSTTAYGNKQFQET